MDEKVARRSTLLLAASSGVSFALNLLRTKLIAIAWGPIGVGHTGLMQAAMGTATLASGLGIDGLMARDAAQRSDDPDERSRMVAAATIGASMVAMVGGALSALALALYLPRVGLSGRLDAGVLAVGVSAGVVAANIKALLSGLGAARTVAASTVAAAALAFVAAAAIVLAAPSPALLAGTVAIVPVAALVALAFAARQRLSWTGSSVKASLLDVLSIARRATVFTVAGVLPPLAQTAVRSVAATHLNGVELGQMQAAAAIAAISTSLLAASVGPVVIPQLTAAMKTRGEISGVLGRHTVFLISLYAPLAIGTACLSDVALRLLYSVDFAPSGPQLAWQIVGEVLRLPVWLMATALVVLQRGRAYLLLESVALITQLAALSVAFPTHEPALIGMAFAASSGVQFMLATWLLRYDGFTWQRTSLSRIAAVTGACVLTVALPRPWSLVVGLGAAIPASYVALRLVIALRSPRG